ncbi:hypothetical protein D3C71_1340120 [compost metagenome]
MRCVFRSLIRLVKGYSRWFHPERLRQQLFSLWHLHLDEAFVQVYEIGANYLERVIGSLLALVGRHFAELALLSARYRCKTFRACQDLLSGLPDNLDALVHFGDRQLPYVEVV